MLFGAETLAPRPREVAPGAVHIPGWLDAAQQRDLVDACRDWARGPAGMRPGMTPGGRPMSVQTVWLGWNGTAGRYRRETTAGSTTEPGAELRSQVAPMPATLIDLGRRAITAAQALSDALQADQPAHNYRPDVALINFYDHAAKMGLHQDKDETSNAPIVSISLGDTALFRLGNNESRNKPWQDIDLASGDLFVFGGPSRMAFHGVPMTRPQTAPEGLGLIGRLNLTLRQTGHSPQMQD